MKTSGLRSFRDIQVDESNILSWTGLIIPVSFHNMMTAGCRIPWLMSAFFRWIYSSFYFHLLLEIALNIKSWHDGIAFILVQNLIFLFLFLFSFRFFRKIRHIQKVHLESRLIFQQNIHLSHQKFASKQKFIIRTSMKRAKFVCQ